MTVLAVGGFVLVVAIIYWVGVAQNRAAERAAENPDFDAGITGPPRTAR
jgi:hypothetical protein